MNVHLNSTPYPVSGFITIDGAHSKDLDDGFSLKRLNDHAYALDVFIANPSTKVKKGSPVDERARLRGYTVYRGTSVVSGMLPRSLAEETLTLSPGKAKEVVRVSFELKMEQGGYAVHDVHLSLGNYSNQARLSHEEVIEILDGQEEGEVNGQVREAYALSERLLVDRRNHGALAIYSAKSGVYTDEDGNLVTLERKELARAYILVQELMILANRIFAESMIATDTPIIFRNHRAKVMAPSAQEFNNRLSSAVQGGDAADFSHTVELLRQTIGRAEYNATPDWHYGLNIPCYSHFTSPIRRYVDMVNIRSLVSLLQGKEGVYKMEELTEIAGEINERILVDREMRSAVEKKKVNDTAKRLMLSDEKVAAAGEDVFYRMVKAHEGEEDYAENVKAELLKRLGAGALSIKTMAALLGRDDLPHDEEINTAVIQSLKKAGHQAPSLFNILHTKHGFNEAAVDTQPGPGEQPAFIASASVTCGDSGQYSYSYKSTVASTSKAAAKQKALTGLAAKILGVEYKEAVKKEKKATDNEEANVDIATVPEGNHKGDLLELVAKHRLSSPVYEMMQAGPSHNSVFTCKVKLKVEGRELAVTATANSKKAAERAASYLMIEQSGIAQLGGAEKVSGNIDPISALTQAAQANTIEGLSFDFKGTGVEQEYECTASATYQGERISQSARGVGKKEPKKEAAQLLIKALGI